MNDDLRAVCFGPFRFDLVNGLLFKNGQQIPLPPRALGVLALLVRRSGQVVGKQELLETVWKDVIVEEASLKEAISTLRHTLGDDHKNPVYIQTIHRRGYRFVAVPDGSLGNGDSTAMSPSGRRSGFPLTRRSPLIVVIGAIAGAAIVFLSPWQHGSGPGDPASTLRFLVRPPAGTVLTNMDTPILAMAPDGSRFAFVAREGDTTVLYLRALGQLHPMRVRGSQGAEAPFFSPSGKWLGFCADGALKIVQPGRGGPISLAPLRECDGASWGENGEIVFGSASGLWTISASGGTPTQLTNVKATQGAVGHWWPDVLPDGSILFTVWKGALSNAQLALLRPGARTYRVIYVGGSDPQYVPGRLLLAEEGGVVILPFEPHPGRIRGTPIATDTRVAMDTSMGIAQVAVAANGSRVSFAGSGRAYTARIDWVDKSGKITPSKLPPRAYGNAALSPDGTSVAVTIDGTRSHDIWIGNLGRGSLVRLTDEDLNTAPIWSPDGTWITYASTLRGQVSIWRLHTDGSGEPQLLTAGEQPRWPNSYSPDGARLAFSFTTASDSDGVGVLSVDVRAKAVSLLQVSGNSSDAQFSPDGRWIAYLSDASGRFPGSYQVLLRAFPDPGPVWPVSIGSAEAPVWAPNGRTLYYQSGDAVWAVPIRLSTPPLIGKPRRLFEIQGVMLCGVSPDGKRLLVIIPDHADNRSDSILVQVRSTL